MSETSQGETGDPAGSDEATDSSSPEPTSGDEGDSNPFARDPVVQQIAEDIVVATHGVTPSDSMIAYNLVWDVPFFRTVRQGFQIAAQEAGFSTEIVTIEPAEWPPTGTLPDYRASGADAYISHWMGGVYVDSDVPWFVIEPGADVSRDVYWGGVTSDNDGLGQLLADLMLDSLDVQSGSIAIYGAGEGPGMHRGTQVKAILERAGFTVVGAPDSVLGDTAEKVYARLPDDLAAHPDIVGIVGTLGYHGGAVGFWLQDNGYAPGEIEVVATDFEAEAQEALLAGYITATVVQKQYWWGYLAGYVAYGASVLGEEGVGTLLAPYANENGVVTTDFDTVTPENSQLYLDFLAEVGVLE